MVKQQRKEVKEDMGKGGKREMTEKGEVAREQTENGYITRTWLKI